MQSGSACSPDSELKNETFAPLFGFLHTKKEEEGAVKWDVGKHSQHGVSCPFNVNWRKASQATVWQGVLGLMADVLTDLSLTFRVAKFWKCCSGLNLLLFCMDKVIYEWLHVYTDACFYSRYSRTLACVCVCMLCLCAALNLNDDRRHTGLGGRAAITPQQLVRMGGHRKCVLYLRTCQLLSWWHLLRQRCHRT